MSHTNITLYGTLWCSDCKRAKKFFGEQRVHYNFVDVDSDKDGLAGRRPTRASNHPRD